MPLEMTKLLLLWNVHFKAMFGVTVLTSKCFRLMHCYRYGKRSAHLSFSSLKAGFVKTGAVRRLCACLDEEHNSVQAHAAPGCC